MSGVGQLYRLQLVDSEWEEKSCQLAEVSARLGETEELKQARESVAEMEGRLGQLRKQIHDLELEIGGLDAKFKANQERLYGGRVRNPKELAGLQEEAAALRRRRSEREDRQLELMIAVEEGEAELAERQARLHQIEESWRADQAEVLAEKERLEERLAELQEQQSTMREQMARADLALYDDLRRRLGPTSVALIRGGVCQVCGVDVPVTLARSVERGLGLNYCPICNRLLYGGG